MCSSKRRLPLPPRTKGLGRDKLAGSRRLRARDAGGAGGLLMRDFLKTRATPIVVVALVGLALVAGVLFLVVQKGHAQGGRKGAEGSRRATLTVHYERESESENKYGEGEGASDSERKALDATVVLEVPDIDYFKKKDGEDQFFSIRYGHGETSGESGLELKSEGFREALLRASGLPGPMSSPEKFKRFAQLSEQLSETEPVKLVSFTGQASSSLRGKSWSHCLGPPPEHRKGTWTGTTTERGDGTVQGGKPGEASFSLDFTGEKFGLLSVFIPVSVMIEETGVSTCGGANTAHTMTGEGSVGFSEPRFDEPGEYWTTHGSVQSARTPSGYSGKASLHLEGRSPDGRSSSWTHETISFTFEIGGAPELTVKILDPQPDSDQVFDNAKLVIEAKAKVEPAKYAKDVEWEVEDIEGSEKTIEPKKGDKVEISFDGLPEKNDQFGKKKITARVGGKQDQVTVKVFFKRDGKDNPYLLTPNWFYYWKQTRAASGHADAIQYGKGQRSCRTADGFFSL